MSAADTEAPADTDAGKFVIWIAGGIGIAAVVAYGTYQLQRRSDARAETPVTSTSTPQARPATVPFEVLSASVDTARDSWNVTELAKVEQELAVAEGRLANPADAHSLRLSRAEATATRGLEAAIRAGTIAADKPAAQAVADRAIADGRAILGRIDSLVVDQTRLGAAGATLALAAGEDIGEQFPAVLLPSYHDPSLRFASLAQPLWRGDRLSEQDLEELTTELSAVKHPNGLTRALLALALDARGDAEGALAAADAMLADAPRQPFALGMRAKLTTVAASVHQAPPVLGDAPDEPGLHDAAPSDVSPTPADPPAPEEPKVEEPKGEEPKGEEPKGEKPKGEEPTGEKPTGEEPKADKPKADKPKADKPKADKPKADKPSGFDALLAEGCKLAKTDQAEAGFTMLKKAHDLSPGGTKVTLCMAQAQAQLGRDSSARAFLDRVLNTSSRNKTALLLAAKLDTKAGNTASALKLYRRVLEVDPENATALSFVEQNG